MKLWIQIAIGLVAGVIVGVLLGAHAEYLKPIGDVFISAIKMLIVPLVFASLVVGVNSMKDPGKMGRVGLKTFGLYLATTAIAITLGLVIGAVAKPGAGLALESAEKAEAKAAPTIAETLVGLVPRNPVEALASGNILQVIVFAVLLGISINLAGEKGKALAAFFDSLAEVMYKLTGLVMRLAPFGVFALMAWVAGTYGLSVLMPLIKVVLAVFLGCIVHVVLAYGGALFLLGRLRPLHFFRGIVDALAVAFTTSSSSGTLPVTFSCVQKNLGVSRGISSFVLPLGATINMDGTALYQGVCVLFVAQACGVDLSFGNYLTIILTSTLASIGTAGVPGAGLIMLSLVLGSVGLPLSGVALIAGIDRVLDMARTATNVTGDAMVSVLVAKSEGELDLDVYKAGPEV